MWFSLSSPDLELRIRLEDMSKVRIHEEIIPELLEKLKEEISKDGVVKHPVIADANTLVALDGMHRIAALGRLGCKHLPSCLIDYQSPSVRVGSWYRVIMGERSAAELMEMLKPLGLEFRASSIERALNALDRRESAAALLTRSECYLLEGDRGGIRESYALIKRMELAFMDGGMKVGYETESDALRKVKAGGVAALMTQTARKEEVVEAAISGELFAHKTTRHIVPARPMRIDVPLEWLMGGSLEEVNRMLIERLSKRGVKRLPKGSLFEGRRYEEELWIFE